MKGGLVRDYKDEGRISQRLQLDPGLSAKERRLTEMKGGLARDSKDEGRIRQKLQMELESVSDSPSFIFANPLSFTDNPRSSWSLCLILIRLPAKERRLTQMKGGLASDSKAE